MRTPILRWLTIILGGFAGLIAITAFVVYVQSEGAQSRTYAAPAVSVAVSVDEATLARGRYLAEHVSVCVDCHGEDLGGGVVVDDPAIGYAPAPNLTTGTGGVGGQLSDADIARVLWYGVRPDGRSVRVMPAEDYQHLSEADLRALIAYVRSRPPVDKTLPAFELRPVGRLLLVTGGLPIMIAERIDFAAARGSAPPAGVTAEHGQYLANIAGCTGCHRPDLGGGPIPGAPPDWPEAANITRAGAIADWTEADFLLTLRTGVDKTGHAIDPVMPVFRYAGMTDDDLKAIWQFISTAPPKVAGGQ